MTSISQASSSDNLKRCIIGENLKRCIIGEIGELMILQCLQHQEKCTLNTFHDERIWNLINNMICHDFCKIIVIVVCHDFFIRQEFICCFLYIVLMFYLTALIKRPHSESSSLERKTSQELRMLSSVTINCQITKIVMNSDSQLLEL